MIRRGLGRRAMLRALALAPLVAARPARRAEEGEPVRAVVRSSFFYGRLSGPWGVAADGRGALYVTDARSSGVLRTTLGASTSSLVVGAGTRISRVRRPQGVAVSASGEVYVVDGGNRRIQVFGPDGTARRAWGSWGSAPGQFNVPRGIALDPEGFVYVADGFNDRIQKFTAAGDFVRTWGQRGRSPGQFSTPTGIAVGPSGTVYVADTFRDRVQAFTPDGVFIRMLAEAPTLRNPIGIAVDVAERIYVTEDVDHQVVILEEDGSVLGTFGAEGSAAGQFQFPGDIDVDDAGLVYVADSFNHRVQVFSTSLPTLIPPPEAHDLAIGVALTASIASPLPHNLVNWRVRLAGRLWTVDFRSFFVATGGRQRWGWPISEPFREDDRTVTQYFQRGVMDWGEDGCGGRQIFPRPMWDALGGGRGGAPDFGVETGVVSEQPGDLVGTWGHRVSNFAIDGTEVGFKELFDRLGGAAMFGAPRTDARPDTRLPGTVFDPGAPAGVIRQYFQNAVFEFVPASPEPVRLRLLGDDLRNRLYPNGRWRELAPFTAAAPATKGEQIEIPRLQPQ